MLTAGQLCVLLPGGAQDPCEPVKGRRVQRCLFGSPDPADTQRLLEEQLLRDRERMLRVWGFDTQTSTPVDSGGMRVDGWEPTRASVEKQQEVEPARPGPYSRQTRISDFWRVRRTAMTVKNSALQPSALTGNGASSAKPKV